MVFLIGAVGLAAGPLSLGKKNAQFQPGQARQPAILRPTQVQFGAGSQRFAGVTVQKISPLVQMPARVELGRSALRGPRDAKIQPSVQPAGANH